MKMHLLFVLVLLAVWAVYFRVQKKTKEKDCLSRNIFMAELIDEHCGTFYNLGTVLV